MSKCKYKILPFGSPELRKKAVEVKEFNKELHKIIDGMAGILRNRNDGAALAATQIGILKQIVVIDTGEEYFELINPVIVKKSGKQTGFEGCLSFNGFQGEVTRAEKVVVEYKDRNGEDYNIEAEGFMARCFQHEIDHLDGILYIDRMKNGFLINNKTEEKISLKDVLDLSNNIKKELPESH
jgi:peptide deformylase